jgi:hypothetical protein
VEFIGIFCFTALALVISLCIALLFRFIAPLRRFSLAIFLSLPACVVSMFLVGWTVNDKASVCGPNPEWDRCPSTTARVTGWAAWLAITIGAALVGYWGQRAFAVGRSLLFQSEPTTIFRESFKNSSARIDPPETPFL